MTAHADLHTHSTISDGTIPPCGIVDMAIEAGLGGIALTDHDTVDGIEEFMNTKAPDRLQRIPGLEVSTTYNGKEVHLLGYFIPRNSSQLQSKLQWISDARQTRFPKMIERLREIDEPVEKEELDRLLEGVTSPGRPHVGRILIERGLVQDMDEAFDRYLNRGRPLYVEKEKIGINEAISLLRDVGAVPVLAHPLTIRGLSIYETLIELHAEGLLGVEVSYDYSHRQLHDDPLEVLRACNETGLIQTGGTDYHGPGWRIPIGGISVSMSVVEELRTTSIELGGEPDAWS
ncbi:MAG: PHP domain-containing protein [Candidatus Thorarchaeota archaeon]|jgi:predicted metal-dependent phosphoesterase TrpH